LLARRVGGGWLGVELGGFCVLARGGLADMGKVYPVCLQERRNTGRVHPAWLQKGWGVVTPQDGSCVLARRGENTGRVYPACLQEPPLGGGGIWAG
jgi:hypothetical protein